VQQSIDLQEDNLMLKLLLELAERNVEYLLPELKRLLDMMVKVGGGFINEALHYVAMAACW